MSREAMQQALEALEALKWRGLPSFVKDATTALRQALAEPEQEHDTDCHLQGICQRSGYTLSPTQRKPLTDEERVNFVEFCGFLKYSAGYYEAICVTHSVEAAHGITGEQK